MVEEDYELSGLNVFWLSKVRTENIVRETVMIVNHQSGNIRGFIKRGGCVVAYSHPPRVERAAVFVA